MKTPLFRDDFLVEYSVRFSLKSNLAFYTYDDLEFDEKKSQSNLEKHGIDFNTAQLLWDDDKLIEVRVRHDGEPRYIVIGLIDEKFWTAVITYRGEHVRIISVRRSRKSEVYLYES